MPLIEATRTQLWLAPHVWVDVREQIYLARQVLDPSTTLDEAARDGILNGELLPDWYDEWVHFERERLRQLRLHALEILAQRLMAEGRYGQAVETALAALRGEPLRESAHRVLIASYLAEGNRAEGIRQYRLYRDLLRRKLGVEPCREIEALMEGLPA